MAAVSETVCSCFCDCRVVRQRGAIIGMHLPNPSCSSGTRPRAIWPFEVCLRGKRSKSSLDVLQVNGKVFYIDADHFGDPALLALLSPPDPDQPPPQATKLDPARQ